MGAGHRPPPPASRHIAVFAAGMNDRTVSRRKAGSRSKEPGLWVWNPGSTRTHFPDPGLCSLTDQPGATAVTWCPQSRGRGRPIPRPATTVTRCVQPSNGHSPGHRLGPPQMTRSCPALAGAACLGLATTTPLGSLVCKVSPGSARVHVLNEPHTQLTVTHS